jgi:hypothetical protein
MNAAAVKQPGVLPVLVSLNDMESLREAVNAVTTMRIRPMRAHNYAQGGLVVDGEPGQGRKIAGLRGEIALEKGLVWTYLESKDFDRLLVRKIIDNQGSIRAIVGR